jgi:hypothetical protein
MFSYITSGRKGAGQQLVARGQRRLLVEAEIVVTTLGKQLL